ncbi:MULTISPECIES: HAD family phosphatase [unclassified Streptomyces]|uniref:HAD family hydrolase n=1 Tax=unclassified Streptomyces TaxID=2593676 RepID=UPI001012C5BD|nr:HAD family phosphatase [Streptomyces sp. GZWMJZ-114]
MSTGPQDGARGRASDMMVWFDFGGVLSPPLGELFRAFEKKTGISPEQLRLAMEDVGHELGLPPLAPIESGAMPEAEWTALLSKALRQRWPGLDQSRAHWDAFGRQWFEGVEVNAPVAEAVRRLGEAGFRVGVLSNNVREWEPYWRAVIAPAGELDFVVDSCLHGVRKPEPAIFALAQRTAAAGATDCVLVDDLVENCAAAEAAGWTAVHFRDTEQALRELSAVTGVRLCRLP